jgi:hypothetical protein
MKLVARSHDIKMLEDRLRNAKSQAERNVILGKMDALRREGQDPEIARLREQLVGAARAGDSEAGEKIGEQIYAHQKRKGIQ